MSDIDGVMSLYVNLCYNKIEKSIGANMNTGSESKMPIKVVYQNYKGWKKFTKTTINPKTKVVYDKLLEYQMNRNKNAEKYVLRQRSYSEYLVIRAWLKIKYTLWILFWYVRN